MSKISSRVVKSIKRVGSVAKSSIPIIEKGVSAVYDTMATGLDVGVKSVKGITRSRSSSLAGGRRTRKSRRSRRNRRRNRRH